jgi:hypothetical protein
MKLKVGGKDFGTVDDARVQAEKKVRWDVVHRMMVESLSHCLVHHRCVERMGQSSGEIVRCSGYTEAELLEFRRVINEQLRSRFGRRR